MAKEQIHTNKMTKTKKVLPSFLDIFWKKDKILLLFLLIFSSLFSEKMPTPTPQAFRTNTSQSPQNADLLKAAQNPIANLVSVPFQNNFNFGWGPHDELQYDLNIQPVYPIELPNNWLIITRNIFPIVSQPWPKSVFGLGDLTSSLFITPPPFGSFMIGVGPVFGVPIATDKTLGSGKLAIGPTAVLVYSEGPWVIGGLINNLWSIAGSKNRPDTNVMTLQPFINYNLPKEWFVFTSPIMTANWRENSKNCWTLPVGGGIGKLTQWNKQPINISLSVYYNILTPKYEEDWTIRFVMQFLFPK